MTKFVRCVGVDRMAYHVNVEQIAWMFRPRGATHTVIRFSGSPDALSVLETPQQIASHGEFRRARGPRFSVSTARTRTLRRSPSEARP